MLDAYVSERSRERENETAHSIVTWSFQPFYLETTGERGMDDAGGFHRISYSRDDILLMFYGLFQRWPLVGGGSQLESLLRTSISLFLSRSPFWG